MLRDIPTKDLVEELSKRQGVNTYKAEYDARYQIMTKNQGLAEETGLTTIKEEVGPAIILEIID